MYPEWPPAALELPVSVTHEVLRGPYLATIRLDDVSFGGGVQPLLDTETAKVVVHRVHSLNDRDRKLLEWTARWKRGDSDVLVINHEDQSVVELMPDSEGRYYFTEDFGWTLVDDLPPLAAFLTARSRLRADRSGADLFDSLDERHHTARQALDALGAATGEILSLAVHGLDPADRFKDHAVLIDALVKAANRGMVG
ncbi:MAG TPA: hypothetical protein VF755_02390 [Catenuloplanes sp.]